VVFLPYLPLEPQYVIIIITSTCLVAAILMTIEPGTPLAESSGIGSGKPKVVRFALQHSQ
jgi:preprotein translocase subunit SecG